MATMATVYGFHTTTIKTKGISQQIKLTINFTYFYFKLLLTD